MMDTRTTGEQAAFDIAASRAYLRDHQEQEARSRERLRHAALEAVRAAIHEVLPRFPAVRRAYLFGSILRVGRLRSSSDIDIAVEGKLDAEHYFALWRELEQATPGWTLDLVEIDRDLRFGARVRERGELIYERPDPHPESRHPG